MTAVFAGMARPAARRDPVPLSRAGGGHRLSDDPPLARGRRQGRGALPGLFPGGDRARGRPAAVQGARRSGRGDAGRFALRLLPLLHHQDVARARAVGARAARPVRDAPDLRCRAQPRRRVGPQRLLPLPDSLSAAEPELRASRPGTCATSTTGCAGLCEEIAGRADHATTICGAPSTSSTRTAPCCGGSMR